MYVRPWDLNFMVREFIKVNKLLYVESSETGGPGTYYLTDVHPDCCNATAIKIIYVHSRDECGNPICEMAFSGMLYPGHEVPVFTHIPQKLDFNQVMSRDVVEAQIIKNE